MRSNRHSFFSNARADIVEFGTTRHDFEAADRIDVLCDAFEDEYRAGRVPVIEDFVARSSEPDRSDLIVELVLLDVNYRERQGETPMFADYADRFPGEREALRRRLPLEPESADQSFESTVTGGVATRIDDIPPLGQLGRYELLEQLGTGGFGEVWKARDPVLNREVAVKSLRSDREFPPDVVNQFLEEGRKLARLEHPFIVPAYDVGYVEDRCYIVSKLIEGETLEEKIRRESRLPAADAAEIVARVADALHHAHLQGLVHRDIKPSNILLDRTGRPHLADFGLAISEEEQLDEGPSTVGTYAYMSPEQVRGASHLVDARSDIYSLGVVLYRLVTGRTPFLGRNRSEWEQQIQSRPPRPPRTIKDDIPAPLEDVCLKCLSKDIDQRYRTAGDLADALRDAVSAVRPSSSGRVRWGRVAALIGVSILVIAGLVAGFKDRLTPLPANVVTPRLVMWPVQDGVSGYRTLDDGKRILLDCEQWGLIELGQVTESDTSFSTDLIRTHWVGQVGVFWAWGPTSDSANERQVQMIHFCRYPGEGPMLERASAVYDRTTSEMRSYENLAHEPIPDPQGGVHRLTIHFRAGVLDSVEWDGRRYAALTSGISPLNWGVPDEAGPVGVYVAGTNATFSDIRVNDEPLVMPPASFP